MTNHIITQTHPNKGIITVGNVNHIFYVNNQIGPCIHSKQPVVFECESLVDSRLKSMIKFNSINDLVDELKKIKIR